MELSLELLVVLGVIAARLLVPLLIVRWPLAAIIANLLIKAADQSIFVAIVPDADLFAAELHQRIGLRASPKRSVPRAFTSRVG